MDITKVQIQYNIIIIYSYNSNRGKQSNNNSMYPKTKSQQNYTSKNVHNVYNDKMYKLNCALKCTLLAPNASLAVHTHI